MHKINELRSINRVGPRDKASQAKKTANVKQMFREPLWDHIPLRTTFRTATTMIPSRRSSTDYWDCMLDIGLPPLPPLDGRWLNTSSVRVAYLRTGRLARMDLYNHPIAVVYGDGADGLVSHAQQPQLTRALYAQAQDDELVPTPSSLSRKALQLQLTSASMETVLLRPSCSGVLNLNRGLDSAVTTRPTPHRNRYTYFADCKISVSTHLAATLCAWRNDLRQACCRHLDDCDHFLTRRHRRPPEHVRRELLPLPGHPQQEGIHAVTCTT
jgi:hypothetical protein